MMLMRQLDLPRETTSSIVLNGCGPQVMDMLVEQTHEVRHQWRNNERGMRFTDTRMDEQQRGVSLKMVPMTLILEASSGKSHAINLVDTPGKSLMTEAPHRQCHLTIHMRHSNVC